jgi:hypothetical protein
MKYVLVLIVLALTLTVSASANQVPPGGGFPPCNSSNAGAIIYVNGFRFKCIPPNWTYYP